MSSDASPRSVVGGLTREPMAESSTVSTRLLTAEDLAERWSVSTDHVYRLARDGRIPTVPIGRYKRFRLPAIEAWERAQEGGADV